MSQPNDGHIGATGRAHSRSRVPVRRLRVRRGAVVVLALASSVLTCGGASAQGPAKACVDKALSARGEPASFPWLALAKARGNWRARVRSMPNMGADYADWSAADEQVERCIENDGSVVCTVSGIPCRH